MDTPWLLENRHAATYPDRFQYQKVYRACDGALHGRFVSTLVTRRVENDFGGREGWLVAGKRLLAARLWCRLG